jgi:hypothetical protein
MVITRPTPSFLPQTARYYPSYMHACVMLAFPQSRGGNFSVQKSLSYSSIVSIVMRSLQKLSRGGIGALIKVLALVCDCVERSAEGEGVRGR